jgi:hypothetical protein
LIRDRNKYLYWTPTTERGIAKLRNQVNPGIPNYCYDFPDPFSSTGPGQMPKLNMNVGIRPLDNGDQTGSQNGGGAWNTIRWLMKKDVIAKNMIIDHDPLTQDSFVPSEGFIVAEFAPPVLQKSQGFKSVNIPTGVIPSNNWEDVEKHRDIPCYDQNVVAVNCDNVLDMKESKVKELHEDMCTTWREKVTLAIESYTEGTFKLRTMIEEKLTPSRPRFYDPLEELVFGCSNAINAYDNCHPVPPFVQVFTDVQKERLEAEADSIEKQCLANVCTWKRDQRSNCNDKTYGQFYHESQIGEDIFATMGYGNIAEYFKLEVPKDIFATTGLGNSDAYSKSGYNILMTDWDIDDVNDTRESNFRLLIAAVNTPFYHLFDSGENCLYESGPRITSAMKHSMIRDGARKECLTVSRLTGTFNCMYYTHEGLRLEDEAINTMTNSEDCTTHTTVTLGTNTPIRGLDMDCGRRLRVGRSRTFQTWNDVSGSPHEYDVVSTEDTDRVLYVLFTRMMLEFFKPPNDPSTTPSSTHTRRQATIAFVRPQPHDMFGNLEGFKANNFKGLDIANIQRENDLIAVIQGCVENDDIPDAPDYKSCNPAFNTVLEETRENVNVHLQHKGPIVVPSQHTLMWSGFHASLMMGRSIPAWASASRIKNESDGFVSWLLHEDQCKKGTAATVCHKMGADNKIQHFNPWMGGKFNPYENCDTHIDADSGRNQEMFDSYCTDVLCTHQRGKINGSDFAHDDFYTNMCTPTLGQCWQSLQEPTGVRRTGKEEVNVDSPDRDYGINLCFHKPVDLEKCHWGKLNLFINLFLYGNLFLCNLYDVSTLNPKP